MKYTSKKYLICALALMVGGISYAAPKKVCGITLSQSGCNATLSFETDRYGDVVITLTDKGTTTGAVFRDQGMEKNLDKFWVKVPGYADDSACHYFERQMVAGSNVFRLKKKEGVIIPEGADIYFKGTLTWMCDQNNNLWQSNATYTHTYGTTCATLDTPVLNGMDDNYILDFTTVAAAQYYTVAFYLGKDLVYCGKIEADNSTSFRPYMSGTYEIVVQAWTNSGLYSNESDPIEVTLTGDPQYLPASDVCEVPFEQGKTSCFKITAETDANGIITITAVAGDGGDEAGTVWRNNGLKDEALKFDGQEYTLFFKKTKSKDNKSLLLTPIAGKNPQLGKLLTYNEYGEGENAEWKTSQNTNCYSKAVHFAYRYGTVCPQLATPVITAITDSVPVFEAIEGADMYEVQVYLNGQLKYKQYIQPGDMLHFVPDQNATYQVTMTAYGEGIKQSDMSDPFDWELTKKEIEVGPSEYCNVKRSSGVDQFAISFETLVNGDVEITISGDAKTTFRGNGMGNDLSAFKVGALGAAQYFEPDYIAGAQTYTLHLKDPNYVPAKGEKIVFSGTVAYQTAGNSNAYSDYTFTYTYGSVCDHLETPVITDLQADGTWILDHPIEGAEAYRVMVYRDGFLMQDSEMQLGDKLIFSPWHDFIYLVSVQAVTSKQVMNSEVSNPYEWRVTATDEELPKSVLCDKAVASDACGAIYLTAETWPEGDIVFTIHNKDNNVIFRNKGLDKLLFVNDPVETYFDAYILEDDSTMFILTPKKSAAGLVYSGDPIISMGNLEWTSDCNNNGYTKVLFTYLVGTDCSPRLTRLDKPVITDVSPLGAISFSEVDNAVSYRMKVSDGDDGLIGEYTVNQGDVIDRYSVILPEFDYYVRVQAWPAIGSTEYRESLWSDPYLWNPSVIPTGMYKVDGASIHHSINSSFKMIEDGRFVIILNGKRYNVVGEPVNR